MKNNHILVFRSREICYFSGDFFLCQMAEEFEKKGYIVDTCNLKTNRDLDEQLDEYIGRDYAAIIDFNSLLPRMAMDDGQPYLDMIHGPFYNYIVDHPLYHHAGLSIPLKDYHAICIDHNHVKYIQDYYTNIKEALFLPLGATKALGSVSPEQKKEEILFIGTYHSAADVYEQIKDLPPEIRADVDEMIEMMLADESLSQEEAFRQILNRKNMELTGHFFADRMNERYLADKYLRNYVRQIAVNTLVEHKIPVTVLGNGWEQSERRDSAYLTIEAPVDFAMSFQMVANYAVSLNVSPLFRNGVHDRVFAAMANGTACLTEWNPYVEKEFQKGKDIELYSLKNRVTMPDIATELLTNRQNRDNMSQRAQKEFEQKYSWSARIEELRKLF